MIYILPRAKFTQTTTPSERGGEGGGGRGWGEEASDMKINMESSISWQKETFCKRKKGRRRKKLHATSFSNPEFGEARGGGKSW